MNGPTIVPTRLGPVECCVTGEGPAVLAVHGAMGGYDQGLLLARTVLGPPGFRVIAMSRPGYLGTPLSLGRKPEQHADLHAALLDALNIPRAAAVAISGGGQSTLQFALRHPDRCKALVMISACSASILTPVPFRFHLMKLFARVPAVTRMMSRGAASRAPKLGDPEAQQLLGELQASVMHRVADRMPGTQNDIDQSRAPFDYPLERIAAPLLVVHGTEDEAAPFEQGRALASRVPGADFFVIEGGRHIGIFTHRDLVRARVTEFLAKV